MLRKTHPPAVPLDCQRCPARKSTICEALEPGELDVVEHFKTGDSILPAGSMLYREGEPCHELYNVLDGWIVIFRILANGRRQILNFALRGEFIGFQPDLEGPMLHGAQCLTDVSVCTFPRDTFPDLLRDHPSLALRMAWLNEQEKQRACNQLVYAASRPVKIGIVRLLLELQRRMHDAYRLDVADPIELPITQEHVADAVGLTNVHVCNTLRDLREEGLLRFRNGQLYILDWTRLVKLAESTSGAAPTVGSHAAA